MKDFNLKSYLQNNKLLTQLIKEELEPTSSNKISFEELKQKLIPALYKYFSDDNWDEDMIPNVEKDFLKINNMKSLLNAFYIKYQMDEDDDAYEFILKTILKDIISIENLKQLLMPRLYKHLKREGWDKEDMPDFKEVFSDVNDLKSLLNVLYAEYQMDEDDDAYEFILKTIL